MHRYLGNPPVKSSKDSKDAKKSTLALFKARQLTPLIDVQRRIHIYLHALWGCEFVIKPTNGEGEHGNGIAFVQDQQIYLPNYYCNLMSDGVTVILGLDIYRAAGAHAAAHVIFSNNDFSALSPSKLQKVLISIIEDARVEALSVRKFPGLKRLWCGQHIVTPAQNKTVGDYLNRLARALLDDTYQDDDAWICQGRLLFSAVENLERNRISWDIGLTLAQSLSNKKIKFNARTDKLSVPYRDDNQYLWVLPQVEQHKAEELPTAFVKLKLLLANNEFSNADAEPEELPEKQRRSRVPLAQTYIYPEWDYRSQTETPDWVTLREMSPKFGELETVEYIVEQNSHLIARMKSLLHAIQFRGLRRIRKLEDGDELDINAAIRSMIDIRQGVPPDPRIMMRSIRKVRDTSVLVLLDLSNSTNQKVQGQEHTVLQLTQQICVLFADVIDNVGDPFAIHGFCSKSRHNVEYFRFKDFEQPYDNDSKARIAGMTGQRATRMGAAIRHATYHLDKQKSNKKLLMIITDGEPSDIDVLGQKYLRYDAKQAVGDAGRRGIHTYCIGLDPNADQYIARIFGAKNYMVVDHVKSLPEKMLMIYAALTL